MEKIVKQTVISEGDPTKAAPTQTAQYLIYFLFGTLDILLLFRLILKLTGANPGSTFVDVIYALTGIFILPFEGIFRRGFAQGVETTSVFEPSALTAIIVYTCLAWGIVVLIKILSGQKSEE